MMRVLALDVGDKRIGIAVSDPLGITAQGLETYNRTGDIEKDAEYIANFAKKYVPVRLLFGMPRNMDGTEGFRAERTRRFAALVAEKTGAEVVFVDERLSTVEAYTYMNITGLPGTKRKGKIDALSAQIILQSYLDAKKTGEQ